MCDDAKCILQTAENVAPIRFVRVLVVGAVVVSRRHRKYLFACTMPDACLAKTFFMSAAKDPVLHLNLDDAWGNEVTSRFQTRDLRNWGPRLRFSAPTREIERFATEQLDKLPRFLIFGSGDFHHLTALWLRRLIGRTTLVSFDNHPDWDIRPPRWSCGAWVNRALDLPQINKVSVWGCGNFECWWPMRIFGNNLAEKSGRLEVHPWADDRKAKDQRRRGAIVRHDWRAKFEDFVASLRGADIYVTIDLDCLTLAEAVTNWESGRFTLEDLAWAVDLLASNCRIVAGDICGAWSTPRYARGKQRFASEMDHPKLTLPEPAEIRRRNHHALERLLPVLTHRNQDDAGADHERTDR